MLNFHLPPFPSVLGMRIPFALFVLATCSNAANVKLSGRLMSTSSSLQSGTSATVNGTNLSYTTNITLNGTPFSVMIDSGSSDLWVSSPVSGAVSRNYTANVTYVTGSASGNVMSATFELAGLSVDSQFFIEAPNANASNSGGLIGLGPGSSSNIRTLGNSSAANPPLDRIFTSNSSVSPYIAVLLERANDPQEPFPGNLAIGEVLPQYQDILNQPRLPVVPAAGNDSQHWSTLLDVNGIIGPNGKPIEITTQVAGAQTQNATVVFDTGYTLPQVSPSVAKALYGDIPGAVFTNVSGIGEIWVLPCDTEVNATFLFAGVEFPIHPLDLNFDTEESGSSSCVGAFQPWTFDKNQFPSFDMLLGMSFLRNAYMVLNFGDLIDAATPSTTTAYIQLLPITNATQAAEDFAAVRKKRRHSKRKRLIIGLIVGIVLLVLIICAIAACFHRRRRTNNADQP